MIWCEGLSPICSAMEVRSLWARRTPIDSVHFTRATSSGLAACNQSHSRFYWVVPDCRIHHHFPNYILSYVTYNKVRTILDSEMSINLRYIYLITRSWRFHDRSDIVAKRNCLDRVLQFGREGMSENSFIIRHTELEEKISNLPNLPA